MTKISVIRDRLISKRKVSTECSKNEAIRVCKQDAVDRRKMKRVQKYSYSYHFESWMDALEYKWYTVAMYLPNCIFKVKKWNTDNYH